MEGTDNREICCIGRNSPAYPNKLKYYSDMPEKIYVKGQLPKETLPAIAIVGARMCSPYGRIQAFRYAKCLSEAGVQVISGMAYGIDSEGHRGAMEGECPHMQYLEMEWISVILQGIKLFTGGYCIRTGNFERISPGIKARTYFFPARNRIISALADVVLVVEAKEKSGSLITAQYALEQGKPVYAVPGAVSEALSRGCHKLIYDGAGIAYTPEVLLSEWGISVKNQKKSFEKNKLGLASDLKLLYSCLDLRPKSLDDLIRRTGLPPEKISSLLLELELMGLARERGRQYIKQDCTDS